MRDDERIYEYRKTGKHPLRDVGIRFDLESANLLRDGWRELGLSVKVFHRYVKADNVSHPIFVIVARSSKP